MSQIENISNTYERESVKTMTINKEADEMIESIKSLEHAKRVLKRIQSERERLMRSLSVITLKTFIKESK